MKKSKLLLVMGAAMVSGLCGCQKSPEESIVANKDFDNMIEQADNTEGSGVTDVSEVAVNYDTYKTTFTDESLGVTINADAKVDIPETSQMSVFRIGTKGISQDILDKVRETLSPGVTYYEGRTTQMPTRSDLELSIKIAKENIAEQEAYADMHKDEDRSVGIEESYSELEKLQELYENTPETIDLEEFPSDNQLHSVNDLYNGNSGDEYYKWQYSLNPNGEIYYGINDATDGNYISLYAQNNEEKGNCLSYRSSKQGYIFNSTVIAGDSYNLEMWQADELDTASSEANEPVTISEDEAKKTAEDLINSLGLTDYKCYESGLYGEIPDIRSGNDYESNSTSRKVYRITYMRNIDGVYVNNEGRSKFSDNWDGDDYVKKYWVGEKIIILVNDSGVVGFDYISPIEISETVVDKSNLKTFDEIKSIFENMSVMVHAKEDAVVTIDIDRVKLRYSRISEADNFDGGLLVPVWDFIGTITINRGEGTTPSIQEDENVLTINAIDGTIIDKTLGY